MFGHISLIIVYRIKKYNHLPITVLHEKVSEATLKNIHPLTSNLLKLHWSPLNVLPVEPADNYAVNVDIVFREYNYTSQEWAFTDIAKGVSSTDYIKVPVPDFIPPKSYNNSALSAIIQIRVNRFFSWSQNGEQGWLLVFGKAILDAVLQSCCIVWELFQSKESAEKMLADLPPCPCTVSEIQEQRSIFENESHTDWNFHPGSHSCFRQRNS